MTEMTPPAGEDVERVARAIADWSDGRGQGPHWLCTEDGKPGGGTRDLARAVLAALSARPVEAQEVERLPDMGQEWPSEEARLRYVVSELQHAAAAALARAEAAEGVIERVRAALAVTGPEVSCGGYSAYDDGCFVSNLAQRIEVALLDGDSEGRES